MTHVNVAPSFRRMDARATMDDNPAKKSAALARRRRDDPLCFRIRASCATRRRRATPSVRSHDEVERSSSTKRFSPLAREASALATTEALLRVHPESNVKALEDAAPAEGMIQLDADTDDFIRHAGSSTARLGRAMQP